MHRGREIVWREMYLENSQFEMVHVRKEWTTTHSLIMTIFSLTYLEMRKITVPCDIGYVLEALSELRALSMSNLDEKVTTSL